MSSITGLVLIVDDTPANLEVISETLRDAGFEVAIATSGEQALRQIERQIPDLILLDVMMPGIDGFETCRRLQASDRTCSVPIIFMTALSDTDSKVQALELGAVDYVAKPFHEKEVLARVRTHLQLSFLINQLEAQVAEKTAELRASQLQVVQSEKMASIGNLVAGVAHELNNPIGFLNGSIGNAKDYIRDLFKYLSTYQQHQPPTDSVAKIGEQLDLPFLQEDLPKLLSSMQSAVHRIMGISASLRTFSRTDTRCRVSTDLHQGFDSTLLILKYRLKANQYRPAITVLKQYGEIPQVSCYPGQLNQVFMNILANAIDMFDEISQEAPPESVTEGSQKITIQTALLADQNAVEIRIGDNGKGMTEAVKAHIFDYLFTTKAVGKGTGLGLAIAHQIVTETHGGSLSVQSELGQGSEFCIRIPIV